MTLSGEQLKQITRSTTGSSPFRPPSGLTRSRSPRKPPQQIRRDRSANGKSGRAYSVQRTPQRSAGVGGLSEFLESAPARRCSSMKDSRDRRV